jgi:adenosylhomocysteine nucleosidase
VTRVGICSALPLELRPLTRARLRFGTCVHLPGGHLATASGVGPERARRAGQRLLDLGATALVSWGSAGALDPSLRPGVLLLPATVVAADGRLVGVDTDWRARVLQSISGLLPVHVGPLGEAVRAAGTVAEKRRMREHTGAIGVDMESAAVGRLAAQAGLPFLAVRAVADTADMDIPGIVMRALDHRGNVRYAKLAVLTLIQPSHLPGLVRLGVSFRAAQAALAVVARGSQALLAAPKGGSTIVEARDESPAAAGRRAS